MTRGEPHILSRAEYNKAVRADHGNVRRYLSGCNCYRCDTPANRRFQARAERVNRTPQK